ncbi:WXG100 family type VII secretion target [Cellulomonas shaoxiangyii]|uniref:ESAT-6-like protein n=1 Tax=Cellulomonas shaoxiangyii TaxID=2566013 RepID=A0A4P7SGB6_9CELL|nr:WXG100 family type VII secretion target [Cellulomonas shaoxiangyii]QCB92517.1 WXG100 family type VII secretion target [Cellulomonas shaoxiangyii]TGY83392.1 WXG100 family type VII secretion target [Cellulomonas shaoxiangyii]
MPRFKVDPDGLLRTVEALRVANAGIEAELERLDAQVRRLDDAWSGEARDAYARAQAQWRQELAGMNRTLADAARRAANVSARYTATREAVAARWSGA